MRDDGIRLSCWLFADNTIDLGQNIDRVGSFAAYLKHAMLFHERLLVPDSNIVNTANVRLVAQSDPELASYLANDCLVIATRTEKDRYVELESIRDSLINTPGTMNEGFDRNPELFRETSDLQTLQRAKREPYDVDKARQYYTDAIVTLIQEPSFLQALGDDADQICRFISNEISDRRYLRQRFFEPRVRGSLPELLGERAWRDHGALIRLHEMSYYRNAIPVQLDTDVIFSQEHDGLRRILRGIDLVEDKGGRTARVDLSRGSTSMYENLLSDLSVKQLSYIRRSSQFICFQQGLSTLQTVVSMDDPDLEKAITDVYVALHDYHRFIDGRLAWSRRAQEGTAALDDWHLSGFLRGGAWTLRMGAKFISKAKLRVFVATSLAGLLSGNAQQLAEAALGLYFATGNNAAEAWLDGLSDRIAAREAKEQLATGRHDAIQAVVDTYSLIRDTQYN